jgi:hypothetical protein
MVQCLPSKYKALSSNLSVPHAPTPGPLKKGKGRKSLGKCQQTRLELLYRVPN